MINPRSTFTFLFCLFALAAGAQTKTIQYEEDNEDILNPERGFYIPMEARASHFISLNPERLKALRTKPQQPGHASYTVQVSLLYRAYELDSFKMQPLSSSFLDSLQQDFDRVRDAGLKMVLRFAYTNRSHEGNCGDEYKICPPYGDAPRDVVLDHIRQLKPLLQKNADVIAVLQEGFIGIWGENYFTDYFGDASNSNGAGKILDSSWLHRNELLKALLDALPANRMVQVRTPQIKQKFVYGPAATTSSAALQSSAAYNRSAAARIGMHNDCFLASEDDYGTYYDYGSSSQPRQAANDVLRKYAATDTRFTVVGGETCDDAFSPQNDCAPAGHAEEEMQLMHYSYLNAAYNNAVDNDWDSAGCMINIKRRLGYRFVLKRASFPAQVNHAEKLSLDISLENNGYASPYNPRPVELVFRNQSDKKEYKVKLAAKPQSWFSGSHQLQEKIALPKEMPAGDYQLFMSLPDESPAISQRPEYAIRLANKNTWEAATGYNDLHHTIHVN